MDMICPCIILPVALYLLAGSFIFALECYRVRSMLKQTRVFIIIISWLAFSLVWGYALIDYFQKEHRKKNEKRKS